MKQISQGIPYGVYVWRVNGKAVVNENLDYLQIASRRGDQEKIARLRHVVQKEFGIFDGEPCFEEGARPISQEEWEEQMARQQAGEVPDPYDLGNLIDEYNYQKEIDG